MSDTGEATGQVLSAKHQALIDASAISKEVAAARGYRTITTKAELGRLGFTSRQQRVPALLMPIWGVAGEIVNYHLRPDEPRIGKTGKPLRYEFPYGSTMALDVHPSIRDKIGNPDIPLWITEGERKADAAISQGLCCVAVPGVWNWRGTNAHGGKTLLADWESVALNGRKVYIAYDSDVMTKSEVHSALARLAEVLKSRGAHVRYIYLPSGPGGTKVGLDDYLAAGHAVDDLLVLASPKLQRPAHDGADERYAVTEIGTVWCKRTEHDVDEVPLANFSAVISEEIIEDDGIQEQRVYRIDATVQGLTHHVQVPAAQFAGMTWAGELLGARAVLEPGFATKDRFRHAIQTLSGEMPQSRNYTHTGWRQINEVWVYLHGEGAIGPEGLIPDVIVGLQGPLARFILPDPPTGAALVDAVRTALSLLGLLPNEVAYPVLGATWLAPLREILGADAPDFVPWLHGRSGAYKSEVLALAQGFYGDFSRLSLPLNFMSTANAVERFQFAVKDALLAVDDFHPTSNQREQQVMNQVADRLLRGAGNHTGRMRMRADTTLRPAYDPRSLAMASGERLPEGHSNIARAYPITVAKGAIDQKHLTTAQEQRHHYRAAMAGYVRFLAANFAELQETLPGRYRTLRAELQVAGSHQREPGQLAHLLLGLEGFLDFSVAIGAITTDVREEHLARARQVLLRQGREHAQAQADEASEQLFLRYLKDGLAGKRAYLEAKQGGAPDDAGLWGWERTEETDKLGFPQVGWRHVVTAHLIGVVEGGWLLLFPEQVYQFVVGAAKAAGRVFPVDQATLIRRLDEAGLIATEMESGARRRKVNAWIGGTTRRVLKLRRNAVMPPSSAENREEREGREDSAPDGMFRGADPSRPSGKAETTGKDFAEQGRVVTPILPGLPALPGNAEEGEAVAPDHEEVVEWRG